QPPRPGAPLEFTPLHLAALRGLEDLVAALLAAGADPLARNDLKHTPVDVARGEGHAAVVSLLEEAMPRQEDAAAGVPPRPRPVEG
ncbi:hypothetical protein ACLESD_49875, partial [Pyxidicoccus sp. 3LFB2]